MKVLEIIHSLEIGGAENVVVHLARYLRKRGHSVAIGCLDAAHELGELLREEGFSVRTYGRAAGFDPTLPLRIARHAREFGASVLHLHQYTAFFYGTLAKLVHRKPIVFTEHGLLDPARGWRLRVVHYLASRADAVTAVSPATERHLRAAWKWPGSIEVLPNGIDTSHFRPGSAREIAAVRAELGVPDGARVLGSVGRLIPNKNLSLLLRAFARVARASDRLLIVGDGSDRSELESLARDLGLEERALFLGRRFDVARLLPAFDIYCSTSLREAMPLALLEAAACGVAIVAPAVGGVPEMLHDGEEIAIVPGRPPDGRSKPTGEGEKYLAALVQALESLLANPALRHEMAARARRRVARDYEGDSIGARYERLLRGLSAPRRR